MSVLNHHDSGPAGALEQPEVVCTYRRIAMQQKASGLPEKAIADMKKMTDTLKRLQAMMKDINGNLTQLIQTQQDQIDYLQEKVAILEEIATGKDRSFPMNRKNG